jgi:hypothetical protein
VGGSVNVNANNADAVLGEWAHRGRCTDCGWVSGWVPLNDAVDAIAGHECPPDPSPPARVEIPGQLGLEL